MIGKDIKQNGFWCKSYSLEGISYKTNACVVWNHMKQRCKIGGNEQTKHLSYIGCTMSPNFQDFQFFAEWCQHQIGYGLEDYHIDKDILIKGNKLYAEDRCVFVPQQLNKFLTDAKFNRGIYPQGVCLHPKTNKFQANVNIDNKKKYLGLFLTVEDAFQAYKNAKESEAQRWSKRLENKEFIVDPRVILALKEWQF